jgi:AbrB family looped-hinge helix DNA binding protein
MMFSRDGRLVIPAEFRKLMGLQPDATVDISVASDGSVIIKKV